MCPSAAVSMPTLLSKSARRHLTEIERVFVIYFVLLRIDCEIICILYLVSNTASVMSAGCNILQTAWIFSVCFARAME